MGSYLSKNICPKGNVMARLEFDLAKAWAAIDWLSVIWKSDLTDEIKRSFFQAAVVSILLYGCTIWTLTKRQLHTNAASNIEQVPEAIPHKEAAVRPPTTHHKNYKVRRTRHVEHCWRIRDELISDILPWTLSKRRANQLEPIYREGW